MSSKPIHSITLRAICAATESEEKVKSALSLFIYGNEIETISTEGHFGNTITILSSTMGGKDCNQFIELLTSELSELELERLKAETGERIDDDCNYHLRFDKQAAYTGIVKLATTSDIIDARIKIKSYPAQRDKAIAIADTIF
jgi:RNA binding exosome subunit